MAIMLPYAPSDRLGKRYQLRIKNGDATILFRHGVMHGERVVVAARCSGREQRRKGNLKAKSNFCGIPFGLPEDMLWENGTEFIQAGKTVLNPECQDVMKNSVHDLGLSARAHDKVRRVSGTIADLDDSAEIEVNHLNEVVNFRLLDRQMWV